MSLLLALSWPELDSWPHRRNRPSRETEATQYGGGQRAGGWGRPQVPWWDGRGSCDTDAAPPHRRWCQTVGVRCGCKGWKSPSSNRTGSLAL